MQEFRGKTAVTTGAASGIGYALAERCAREDMKVVLADVEEEALAGAAKNIKEIGPSVLSVKTDVSRAEDVQALVVVRGRPWRPLLPSVLSWRI